MGFFLSKFGKLFWIYDLAVDSSGDMYTTNWDNNAVNKYAPDGTSQLGLHIMGIHNVAIDNSGNIYVSAGHAEIDRFSHGYHRIEKFSPYRTLLTKWGEYGTGDGHFNYPAGIAIDLNGDVYVADSGNSRVQKFALISTQFPAPEFPSTILPATMIIGFLGAVLIIQRTREN
jgi:DNA-binding beta-propeller fold protein YncE